LSFIFIFSQPLRIISIAAFTLVVYKLEPAIWQNFSEEIGDNFDDFEFDLTFLISGIDNDGAGFRCKATYGFAIVGKQQPIDIAQMHRRVKPVTSSQ